MNKEQLTALVAQAQKGNQDAFAQVYNASFQHVFYTARKILQDEQQAQDIAQDVFITVYQKIGELRDPAAYMGWVRQITAYKCSNYIQKKKEVLYSPVDDEDEESGLPDVVDDVDTQPDEVLEKASTKQIILDIIDQLPTQRRAIVMMFFFQQLSIAEISAALGVANGTVKASLNAARKQIKLAVEKEEERSNIKLHSISAIFLFRLFSEDAAASISASSIPQSILDNVLAQGVAGQAATGSTVASKGATTSSGTASGAGTTGATAGKAAAAKGLSLGAKIGLGAAGVAVMGGIVGFVALSMNGNGAPVSSLPMSQPTISSAPVSVVADSSDSVASNPDPEGPTLFQGVPGEPLFDENDLAFVFKYLYSNFALQPVAEELDTFFGETNRYNESELADTGFGAKLGTEICKEYHFGGKLDLTSAIEIGLNWYSDLGPSTSRACDSITIRLWHDSYNGNTDHNLFGFWVGMSQEEAVGRADALLASKGIDTSYSYITEYTSRDVFNDTNNVVGLIVRFRYEGSETEYCVMVNWANGGQGIGSVGLVRADAKLHTTPEGAVYDSAWDW